MSKQTQCARLEKLLTRKRGVTSFEITQVCGTVSPHRRLFDLKARGWNITRKEIDGQSYGRYFGVPPVGTRSATSAQ